MWAFNVFNGFSDKSVKNDVGFFKTIFPDSKIPEKMQLKSGKLKHVLNHESAPYVKEILKTRS